MISDYLSYVFMPTCPPAPYLPPPPPPGPARFGDQSEAARRSPAKPQASEPLGPVCDADAGFVSSITDLLIEHLAMALTRPAAAATERTWCTTQCQGLYMGQRPPIPTVRCRKIRALATVCGKAWGGLRGDCCPCLHEVHFEVLFVFAGAAAPRSPVLLRRLIAWGAGGAGPEERRDEDGARGHAPGTVMGNAPDLGLVEKDLRLQLGIGFFWGGALYGVGMGAARRCA